MAIMYARPSSISRGNNRSAVSAAAYRSGSRMELSFSDMSARVREKLSTVYHEKYHLLNENTREVIGLVFDYRHKAGSIISGIMAPEDAPEWVFDRQKLWQSIENAGSRVDSRLAREHTIALPIELTAEQNRELVEDFIRSSLVARGMVADYNIHLDNPENPHVHVMSVTRDLEVKNDGQFCWGKVNVAWDKLSVLKAIRAEVATIINHHLEMHGHESRISHLSHAERGLDIIPGVHEGFARWRGSTELRKQNQEIAFENASRIIADPTIIIDRLSIDKPVFSGDDIEKALHKALIAGINPDIVKEKESLELWSKEELLSMYNIVVASNKLNLVNPCDLKGRMLFARLDRVELEKRFEENVRELAAKQTHVINIKEEDIAKVARGVEFSGEQKQAIIDILAGSNISVLEGWPGSGKTTVIREIVRHYRKAGYTVIGTAPTNKASAELLAKAGIAEVENTTKLPQIWQEAKGGNKAGLNIRTDYYKEEQYSSGRVILSEKTILIIDEASMVDLPTLDYFTNEIKECGGKVIKIGDNNQNPAIGYKGGLSKTGDIAGRTVLMENNRHQNRDEYVREMHKEATKAMGRYEIAKAISIYEQLEMLRIFDNEEQKQRALADDYSSFVINLSKEKGDLIALSNTAIAAFTNAEVANLNGMVRKSLKNAGIIKGERRLYTSAASTLENQEETDLPKNMVELCLGDKIIFKSNKPEFESYGGVRNNELGIITELGEVDENGVGRFKARIRQGKNIYKVVEIKTGEDILPISFRHGYALTGHAVQGADVKHFFYSVDRHSGYEPFNVGVSRHKEDCFIYLDKETLENVVYGTRDLDISKVKEEFAAYAYNYQKVEDKWKPVDVPLWKVGLRLLISRRTDLNFATDYASYEKDHRQREAYRENIAGNQAKLNKLYDDLNRWREDKETPILENNQQIATDSKGAEELAKELKSLNLLEIALQKDFILKPGEVIIDPLAIAGVVDDYRYLRESTGKKFKSSKDLTNKINKHVASLKLTSCKNNKEKIKWDALDEMDKNLIIRSLLNKKDISFLTKARSQIRKYEEKIISVANKIAVIDESLSKQAAVDGRLLTGNLGGMRRYLDARERVIAAQKAIEELDSYLKKPAIEKQLSYEAFATFGIKVTKFNLTGFGIIRAEKAFKAKHLHDNRDRISQLKNEQEKLESAKELKRLDNIKLQKERYLKGYAEGNNILNDDEDKHLLAGTILQKSKSAILGGKYREITRALKELEGARKERQSKARVIVDYYHGFIRDDPEEKMTAITGPLLKEEELIKEEWMISQKKHISGNSGRGFPDGFSGEHYDAAVLSVYIKDLPVLKKPLCPQVTNISKSRLATLDQKRQMLEPDLEELRKQIEDSRLGKRAANRHEVVMGKLITQLQINYETVRKHAGLEEVKHYFASIDKNGTITNNLHFSRIMEVVELARQEEGVVDSNAVATVMEAHGEILRICAGHQKELDEKKLLHVEIKAKHTDELEQLRVIEKFRNEELPHFLGKIYKNDGRDVLARFEQLLKETDKPLMLAKVIGESPEMLGDIKSTSLWAEFIRGDAVKGIKANLEKLGVNLTKYINEGSMRTELQANPGSGELAAQIRALDLEIANLKALLPNRAEQKLLDDIGHLKDNSKAEQKEINEEMKNLFKGDSAYDLLLDFIALKGKQTINHRESQTTQEVQPPKKSNKVRARSKAQREARASTPKIDFQRVKSSLTRGHIEQIFRDYAQKINPDGKIVKRGNSISCGSLNMNLDNGLWHRFSDGNKGDVFEFICRATGTSKRDSLLTVAGIIGINAGVNNNSKLDNSNEAGYDDKDSKQTLVVRDSFEAYPVIPATAPRLNIDKHFSWLTKTNRIDNIWTYCNRRGELIGGTIRVVDKVTGKKQVMPVCYCRNEKTGLDEWKLKGFTDNGHKPIYGIEKTVNEKKPILIVEGEKTADYAERLLPQYCVISWMGGAQGTAKVNWRQLAGREVIIWPDNDVAGKEAAKSILQELNKANGFSGFASVVDTKSLALPEKWDLADKMPEHITLETIKEAINNSQSKNITIGAFRAEAKQYEIKGEEKIFWQQLSIGIKDNSLRIKHKSGLYQEIKRALASSEVLSYMDYATAKGTDEPVHQFLGFKDALYREMLASSTLNYPEVNAGSEQVSRIKQLFARDKDGNYLVKPKEIVTEVQNIYGNNTSGYQINNEGYINDNKKLAAANVEKAKLHEILMKDFCVLHQNQLGVRELINIHKERISKDLYEIISNYAVNHKNSRSVLKDSDRIKIAAFAHDKINSVKWWEGLACAQIKLVKTGKMEITTETEKRSEVIAEHVIAAMERSGVKNESVFARVEAHYLEYITASANNMNNKKLLGKLVARAVYEEEHIKRCRANMRLFLIEDGRLDEPETAGTKLWQDITAEKLVAAEWHIQEKQPKLEHNEVRSIAKELIYDNYEQEIGRVIKDNPVVSQLAKCNPVVARYLATGLVDFRNSYGKDLLTEVRAKIMEEVSIVQADLHEKIDNRMQDSDDGILSGKHKSLSSNILDTGLLASDREMTAKSVTSRAGEDLTHSLLLRGGSYYEQLHDHHQYHNHGMKTDHDYYYGLEHEYRHEIATQVKQTRAMQYEYHQEMEQKHQRQVNINNDININY